VISVAGRNNVRREKCYILGVEHLIKQGAHDSAVVALGVSYLGSCLAVGRDGQQTEPSQVLQYIVASVLTFRISRQIW